MIRTGSFWRTLHARVAAVVGSLMLIGPSPAAADNESNCNRSIAQSVAHLRKAHQKRISKCLRFGNYDCPFEWLVIDRREAQLRARLESPVKACQLAVNTDGLPLSAFGPAACPDAWNHCDVEVPSIATLEDLADCLVCIETGHDRRMRGEVDFPYPIEDFEARSCLRGGYESMARALRVAIHQVGRCVRETGAKPFACPVDFSPDSKVAPVLDNMANESDRCIVGGSLLDEVRPACNRALIDQADVVQCFEQLTKCLACQVTNTTWDQSEDCAAFAGIWTCNDASPPGAGSFFVANGGDDTATFFEPDGDYAGVGLAAASHAVGDTAWALATNRLVNAVYVANRDDDSVTYLHAVSGAPANGSVASSSFSCADSPAAIAVDEEYGIVFAVGETTGQITLLDATDGSYPYPTQAASTIDSVAGANAVALDATEHVLYVLSPVSDSIVAIRSSDGLPRDGTLAASTFALGIDGDGVAVDGAIGMLYVTSTATDSVTFFDADTLAPAFGTLPASTFTVGDGPAAIAVDESLHRVFVANAAEDSVTVLDGSTGAYVGGTLASSTTALASSPIAIAVEPTLERVYVLNPPSGVTLLAAPTGAYANGTLGNSTFATSPNATAIAVMH